jgi:hypothetical protein
VSFGGSEVDFPESFTADQIQRALALAAPPAAAPPAPSSPILAPQDFMRFVAQQPNQPGGGEAGNPPSVPDVPTDEDGLSDTGGTGNVSNLSDPPTAAEVGGRSGIQAALDAAVNGINSSTGQAALTGLSFAPYGAIAATGAKLGAAGLGLLGFGGPRAQPNVLGNLAEQQAFENAPSIEDTNTATGGGFRGSTPEAQAAFAAQRSGEQNLAPPEVNEAREDAPPAAPPPDVPTVTAPPDVPDISNSPDNPEDTGGTAGVGPSGTGPSGDAPSGPGPSGGGGSSGDSGAGDEARGGVVPRRTHPRGSFRNAPRFAVGGGVPMSERQQRLARIRAFEALHGARAI